ncbi:uncharacterized protein LTR77_010756 [Saxophila tyrrhenica]|uniref:Uncharacterized protein n=1 Tax=Saxophila tyrrhenica TaxID=1690608 RepID=A0AAV9NUM0_9PEZI|nr:hypothetical protein LTR77_010756 [Saxophila tyrrhenica]
MPTTVRRLWKLIYKRLAAITRTIARSVSSSPAQCSQLQSPFFRLPTELRAKIYFLILEDEEQCENPHLTVTPGEARVLGKNAWLSRVSCARNLKRLLRTCRRLRDDLNSDILYVLATSEFIYPSLDKAKQHSASLSPAQRKFIKTITLDVSCYLDVSPDGYHDIAEEGDRHERRLHDLDELGFSETRPASEHADALLDDSPAKFLGVHQHINSVIFDFRGVRVHHAHLQQDWIEFEVGETLQREEAMQQSDVIVKLWSSSKEWP